MLRKYWKEIITTALIGLGTTYAIYQYYNSVAGFFKKDNSEIYHDEKISEPYLKPRKPKLSYSPKIKKVRRSIKIYFNYCLYEKL